MQTIITVGNKTSTGNYEVKIRREHDDGQVTITSLDCSLQSLDTTIRIKQLEIDELNRIKGLIEEKQSE